MPKEFAEALPRASQYEVSYMHRDLVTNVAATRPSPFLLTASVDGHLKFWKKLARTTGQTASGTKPTAAATGIIEFVQHFKAHAGTIPGLAVSADGALAASCSVVDKSIKVFDVQSFDMINMVRLETEPATMAWVSPRGSGSSLLIW